MAKYKSGAAVQSALRQKAWQERALEEGNLRGALDPLNITEEPVRAARLANGRKFAEKKEKALGLKEKREGR